MPTKTCHGTCHCGAIAFEADIDLEAAVTSKCNCTWCWKNRYWSVTVPPEQFRPIRGDAGAVSNLPSRCPTCHVLTFARVPVSDWNPDPKVAINVAALDDLDPAVLADVQIVYRDGRHDNWWISPAEARHL